jgi:hypothetical protein
MVAAARAWVDRFWLTGARDESGSEETLDSEISHGYFNVRADHILDAAQKFNQQSLSSPKPERKIDKEGTQTE